MNNQIVIGVDIGGSHISSAAIDINKLEIIPKTTFSAKINNKASKENIFINWSNVINQTIKSIPISDCTNIAFAMPGPFHYKSGLALFERNDKYENLYNVSIPNQLSKYLECSNPKLRFLNDATSFGVGVSSIGKAKNADKVIAITLGTGFGSSFIKEGIPQVTSENVPKGGCLWNIPYKNGIADDYFSTRWFVKRYYEISEKKIKGVKEIVEAKSKYSNMVFLEFASNLAEFLAPITHKYQPELIILGGNISNANKFFLPSLEKKLQENGLEPKFTTSSLMEEAALIGSAKLFDPFFWNQIKNELPNL